MMTYRHEVIAGPAAVIDAHEALARATRMPVQGTKLYDKNDPMHGGRTWIVYTGWERRLDDESLLKEARRNGPIEHPKYSAHAGDSFRRPARISRSRTRTLVVQEFGWDI